MTSYFLLADNTKKDSDSTPVKGGTDMGEEDVFKSLSVQFVQMHVKVENQECFIGNVYNVKSLSIILLLFRSWDVFFHMTPYFFT